MRVLFNIDSLRPPVTGVGQYTANLLAGLSALHTGPEMACFVDSFQATPAPGAQGLAPRTLTAPGLRSIAARIPGLRRGRDVLRRWQGRAATRGEQNSLYHEPNHILLPFDGHTVVTIHDLSCLHYPDFHPPHRVAYFDRNLAPTIARADRIITDSHFIQRDLQTTLGVDAAKIRVIPLGVDPRFAPLPPDAAAPILARHGLSFGGYVLTMGSREPRKNLERLIAAYRALPQALQERHPLIVAGPPGWRSDTIESALDDLEARGLGRRIGFVPASDLPALYAGCTVFAYPSIYEGFGLPALEAAACGAPVLTSADSPMAEFLGDSALLVHAAEVQSIRDGLRQLLDDADRRALLAGKGPGTAAAYTWAACAAKTYDVYQSIP